MISFEFGGHNTELLTIGVSHDIMHLWHAYSMNEQAGLLGDMLWSFQPAIGMGQRAGQVLPKRRQQLGAFGKYKKPVAARSLLCFWGKS